MNLGLLLLRLIVGGIFAVHGYPKLFGGPQKPVSPMVARYLGPGFVQAMQSGPDGFAGMLRGLGMPLPGLMARFVGAVELFDGLLLMLGGFTRKAALFLIADMVVAIRKVHWQAGLVGSGGAEFPLSLLGACLALFLTGPGDISVDRARELLLDRRGRGLLNIRPVKRLASKLRLSAAMSWLLGIGAVSAAADYAYKRASSLNVATTRSHQT